jgi:FAD/FMN-containing dehydrogenase
MGKNSVYPSNYLAKWIENTLIEAKSTDSMPWSVVVCVGSKMLGCVVFPLLLLGELLVEPLFLAKASLKYHLGYNEASSEWAHSADRIHRLGLGFICSPLAILASDAVSYLFLQRETSDKEVCPFGVEKIYGRVLDSSILLPSTAQEVQNIVRQAKQEGKTISIRGAGMSQGRQTVPATSKGLLLDLRKLKSVEFVSGDHSLVKVGAGSTFENLQLFLNAHAKSAIVKQASDLFSVGGSIGINCHGWEHAYGAIASTVESLEVIDAKGNLRTVSRTSEKAEDRELFRCMFGTLGYFGVIVSATLKVKDNVLLQEKGEEVSLKGFKDHYREKIAARGEDVPLFIASLNINGNPLQKVICNTFEKVPYAPAMITEDFEVEPDRGRRIERICLDALGHLPKFLNDKLVDWFWNGRVKSMSAGNTDSRNAILHFGVKSFFQLHQSDLYTQWLQEYFIEEDKLEDFLQFLGPILEENEVRLLNASIRPTPQDPDSILPYAEKFRHAVVLSFSQQKTPHAMAKTEAWIKRVNAYLLETGGKWYQAYMPYASQEEFEKCYGVETVTEMRRLKAKYDPENLFSNGHTVKYYDKKEEI